MRRFLLFFGIVFGFFISANAQQDTLRLSNGDLIVGEIKTFDKNVIEIDPSYAENLFQIDWDDVTYVGSARQFVVLLTDGSRHNGTISTPADKSLRVITEEGLELNMKFNDVIAFFPYDLGFWSRLDGGFDVSYSLAKASSSQTINGSAYVGYQTDKWLIDLRGSTMVNYADDSLLADRTTGDLSFRLFIYQSWFAFLSENMLSSKEQGIDLRASTAAGIGNYLVRTNKVNLSVLVGGTWTNENYGSPEDSLVIIDNSINTGELLIGSELYTFDLGPVDMYGKLFGYKSLTLKDRYRVDFIYNFKLDFDNDLYVKFEYNMNYDSEPQNNGEKLDFTFLTGIGWEF